MSMTLTISALQINTKIGIYAWEQRILQPLLLDISIPLDTHPCQDTLSNTIDYAALSESVTQLVASRSFKLIETVAEEVATHIQETYNVKKLKLSISKPKAIKNAANVSITIER